MSSSFFSDETRIISTKLPEDIRKIIYNYAFNVEKCKQIVSCDFISSNIIDVPDNYIVKPIICSGEKIKVVYQYHNSVIIFDHPNKYKTYLNHIFISADTDRILMLNNKNQYIRDDMIIKPHIDCKLLYVFDSSKNIKYYVYEFGIYTNNIKIYPDICSSCPQLDEKCYIVFAQYINNYLHITIRKYDDHNRSSYLSNTVDMHKHYGFYTSYPIMHIQKYTMLGDNLLEIVENKFKINYYYDRFPEAIHHSILCDSFVVCSEILYSVYNNKISKYNLRFVPIKYNYHKLQKNIKQIIKIVKILIILCIIILFIMLDYEIRIKRYP